MLRLTLAAALLLSLACAGIEPPAAPADDHPQPIGYGSPPPMTQPAAQTAAPTIQGPMPGDDGALMWVDSAGRITGMYPSDNFLMFGMNGQMVCMRDAYGNWYSVQGEQFVPLTGMPPELASWPGVMTGLPGGYTLPGPRAAPSYAGGGGGGYAAPSGNINDMYHDTSMEIIGNLPDGRAGPVADHYNDDGTYAGSW